MRLRGNGDNQRAVLYQRQRPVLQFARSIRFALHIGNFLEFQGRLHSQYIVHIASDVESIAVGIEFLRRFCILRGVVDQLLRLGRQRQQFIQILALLLLAHIAHLLCQMRRHHIEHHQLRHKRLGRRHGDFRARPGVQYMVRFARHCAAHYVGNGKGSNASALCLTQRRNGIRRFAGLGNHHKQRVLR